MVRAIYVVFTNIRLNQGDAIKAVKILGESIKDLF